VLIPCPQQPPQILLNIRPDYVQLACWTVVAGRQRDRRQSEL